MMKNTKGITLVALVVTIIILLILAGVAITALTQTGLFTKTEQTKEKTKSAETEEKLNLMIYEWNIDNAKDGKTLIDFLNEKVAEGKIENVEKTEDGIETYIDGYVAVLDNNGKIKNLEINLKPMISNIKIFKEDGTEIGSDILDPTENVKITFDVSIKNGEITNITPAVSILDGKATYITNGEEVEKNFEIEGVVNGKIYTKKLKISLSKLYVTLNDVSNWLALINVENEKGYSLETLDDLFANENLFSDLIFSNESYNYLIRSNKIYNSAKTHIKNLSSYTRLSSQGINDGNNNSNFTLTPGRYFIKISGNVDSFKLNNIECNEGIVRKIDDNLYFCDVHETISTSWYANMGGTKKYIYLDYYEIGLNNITNWMTCINEENKQGYTLETLNTMFEKDRELLIRLLFNDKSHKYMDRSSEILNKVYNFLNSFNSFTKFGTAQCKVDGNQSNTFSLSEGRYLIKVSVNRGNFRINSVNCSNGSVTCVKDIYICNVKDSVTFNYYNSDPGTVKYIYAYESTF